jgi:hypothetical protein
MESECEESVEAEVNEREEKDADEVAKDFNGSLPLVSLFNLKSSEANKNNDDEADINCKEAVKSASGEEFQEHVVEVHNDEGGSYRDGAERNADKEFVEYEYSKSVPTDFADAQEKHFTNVADINSDMDSVEREYNEGMPADDFEDFQGGDCKSRAC